LNIPFDDALFAVLLVEGGGGARDGAESKAFKAASSLSLFDARAAITLSRENPISTIRAI
jgi:hypothetical protein